MDGCHEARLGTVAADTCTSINTNQYRSKMKGVFDNKSNRDCEEPE